MNRILLIATLLVGTACTAQTNPGALERAAGRRFLRHVRDAAATGCDRPGTEQRAPRHGDERSRDVGAR